MSYLQKKTYQCIKCQMVFYSEWDIQVHVANHMLGRKQFFASIHYGWTCILKQRHKLRII